MATRPFCEVCSSARNRSFHYENVNMAVPNDYIRDAHGKFSTKRNLEWKRNVTIANKRRSIGISEKKESIVSGRRIVEIKILAEEMWCPACDIPLSFRYVEKEILVGLASIFDVRCHTCLLLHRVRTSMPRKNSEKGHMQYAVNLKSALGRYRVI